MIQCPTCHALHPLNTLFCDECGEYLGQGNPTEFLAGDAETDSDNAVSRVAQKESGQEPGRASPEKILLIIGENKRGVPVTPDKEALLGRADSASGNYPDIDLSDDGGLENGVSRRHAKISFRQNDFFVEDLGSANGTLLNGDRLAPFRAQPLRNGDVLQFGKLMVRVKF